MRSLSGNFHEKHVGLWDQQMRHSAPAAGRLLGSAGEVFIDIALFFKKNEGNKASGFVF